MIVAALRKLNLWIFGLLAALIVADWLAVNVEILSRYLFDAPTIWVGELTEYSLLFIAFLGAPGLQMARQHITVDLYRSLGPRASHYCERVSLLCCVVMGAILTYFSAVLTLDYYQSGVQNVDSLLGVPRYMIVGVIPLGGALLTLQFLCQLTAPPPDSPRRALWFSR